MADRSLRERFERLGRSALEALRGPGGLESDARRERDAFGRGVFDQKNLVLFGDLQAARWPLGKTFARLPVRSRGLDGDRAAVAMRRFETSTVPLRPSAVLIILGTNDIQHRRRVADVAADLRALALRSIEAGIRPTLSSVLPVGMGCEAERPTAAILELNRRIQSDCNELGVFYLDFWEKLADDSERLRADLTEDGLHPNLAGYLRMTEAVLEVFYCRSGQWKRGAPAVW